MAGVGAGVGLRVHWTGVMGTGLGGELLGIWVAGTMVTLGVNSGGVSVGNLRYGAGQSIFSASAGAGRGAFGAGVVWVFSVTFEKTRKSVWIAEN